MDPQLIAAHTANLPPIFETRMQGCNKTSGERRMPKRSSEESDLNQLTAELVEEARLLRDEVKFKIKELRAEVERTRHLHKENLRIRRDTGEV